MNKKSFVLYIDTFDAVEDFTNKELGELMRMIFHYQKNPNNPVGLPVSQKVQIAFGFFKAQFTRDNIKYEEIVEKRREFGKRGGLAKASKSYQKLAKLAKLADSDSDSDNTYKKRTYLLNIPSNDIEEFKSTFNLTLEEIKKKGAELYDYCESKDKDYKNHKALLRTALRKLADEKSKKGGTFNAKNFRDPFSD